MRVLHRDAGERAGGELLATFVLIHGAGDVGWYWHLVEAELRERGHDVVAPDLPCDDDSAGLSEYADTVVDAIADRADLVVVAQSLGGFTAPLVCERVPVKLLVLVAPMIPAPGEAPADYWSNTGYENEVRERYEDTIALFYHDVPLELASEALKRSRTQSEARMGEPSPLREWPDVPTRVLLCRDDRLFCPEPRQGTGRPSRGIRGGTGHRLEIVANTVSAKGRPGDVGRAVVEMKTGSGLFRRLAPRLEPGFLTIEHMTIQRMEHVGIVVDDAPTLEQFFGPEPSRAWAARIAAGSPPPLVDAGVDGSICT